MIMFCLVFTSFVYGATAPTAFTMTTPTATYSPTTVIKVQFTMQVEAAGYDSILIVSNADSSVTVAVVDTTGITWGVGSVITQYVTSLIPVTSYAWQVRVLKSTTHTTSNGDTLETLRINVGEWDAQGDPQTDFARLMRRWDSWWNFSPVLSNTTITLTGTTDSDSTVVYNSYPYTDAEVVVTGVTDSTKCTVLVYAGYCGYDLTTWQTALVDSLNITSAGIKHFSSGVKLPVSKHFYFVTRADADNSDTGTTLRFRLNRSRY